MERPLRILHLEDDPRDAELVLEMLRSGGIACQVNRVDTRDQYLKAIEAQGLDLILSDFTLPAFDGVSALSIARRTRPEIPFILVSGTIGEDAAIESLVGGATDYVLKHRLNQLVPAVRRALAEAENRRARQQAEEAVRASEARYRRLFESSKDGLVVIDAQGRILDANPAILSLLGYDREAVLGRTARELNLAGGDPEVEAAFATILARREARYPDLKLTGRTGRTVDVELVSTAHVADGVEGVQVSVRDIGERRRLEEQLRQSQKLEAVGQLAGGVAHDFNNILAVINSYTELALSTLRPEDPLREDLEQIGEAGARAAALTRQLLAFARKQFFQPVNLSLNGVVTGLEKMLRRVIGEDVDLRLRLASDLGGVRADPAQMEQVLMNLVVNSRDAMPQGGTLVVETTNEVGSHTCGNPEAQPGPCVVLAVSDTGCGMDPSVLDRIFEPFFTTKAPGKGTGLGLATVYGIVRQSGGHIDVESEVGKGTTFRIYLPREASAPAATEAARRPVPRGGSETVLVVEDDEAVRRLVHRILEPAGYQVLSAPNGPAAQALCEQRPGLVNLLLVDVVLPVMDGAAVAEALSRQRPGLRVLFMSGYIDDTVIRHNLPEGGRELIHKPFSAGDLLHKIREMLDRPG